MFPPAQVLYDTYCEVSYYEAQQKRFQDVYARAAAAGATAPPKSCWEAPFEWCGRKADPVLSKFRDDEVRACRGLLPRWVVAAVGCRGRGGLLPRWVAAVDCCGGLPRWVVAVVGCCGGLLLWSSAWGGSSCCFVVCASGVMWYTYPLLLPLLFHRRQDTIKERYLERCGACKGLRSFLDSWVFNIIIGVLILANTVIIAVENASMTYEFVDVCCIIFTVAPVWVSWRVRRKCDEHVLMIVFG